MQRIHIHLYEDQIADLDALSAYTGNDRSEEVRRAINHQLAVFSNGVERGRKLIAQREQAEIGVHLEQNRKALKNGDRMPKWKAK